MMDVVFTHCNSQTHIGRVLHTTGHAADLMVGGHRTSAAESSSVLEAWKIRCNYPDRQFVNDGLLHLRIHPIRENVMNPLHQSVALADVIFLFVDAILVIRIAVITIADH